MIGRPLWSLRFRRRRRTHEQETQAQDFPSSFAPEGKETMRVARALNKQNDRHRCHYVRINGGEPEVYIAARCYSKDISGARRGAILA